MRFKFSTCVAIAAILALSSAPMVSIAQSLNTQTAQQELQQQLQDIQNQIDQYERQLQDIKGQKNTLQNKVNQLKKQQASLQLQIQATNLKINELGGKLTETQAGIEANEAKAQLLEQQIGSFMRTINEQDAHPFLYTVVEKKNLSDVFTEVVHLGTVSDSLKDLLAQARGLKTELEGEKQQFTEQQDQAKNYLSVQVLQQAQLKDSVSEQNTLLEQTKGKESDYQITLNDTRRRAAEIQGRIYDLFGITSGQVTFGQAYKIAQYASQATGLDPAFLLAVLTQESNLGKNVGTCNRPGDPPEKSYTVVMNPTRDIPPFLQITADLGMDPNITPVSCPMKGKNGKQIGWGGAMGPAQFIPSTWVGYKDQVRAITGKAANPWDIRDAFLAAAIKLKAGGADNTSQGEWNAAMRYFSGSLNTAYRFYGDNVLALAQKYQADIATLNQQ